MKLSAGATGFGVPGDEFAVQLRSFTAICYAAALVSGGVVTGAASAGVASSFHDIGIRYGRRRVAVLRHTVLPLVALAQPLGDGEVTLVFVDHPELAAAIADASGLRVLTTGELQAPLEEADLGALAPEEHRQIDYWRPATVGDLVFNFWD